MDGAGKYRHHDIFNDQVTKSKINKHLLDINDTISEDDIRNIKVSIPDLVTAHFDSQENDHKRRTISPWDILDVEA